MCVSALAASPAVFRRNSESPQYYSAWILHRNCQWTYVLEKLSCVSHCIKRKVIFLFFSSFIKFPVVYETYLQGFSKILSATLRGFCVFKSLLCPSLGWRESSLWSGSWSWSHRKCCQNYHLEKQRDSPIPVKFKAELVIVGQAQWSVMPVFCLFKPSHSFFLF